MISGYQVSTWCDDWLREGGGGGGREPRPELETSLEVKVQLMRSKREWPWTGTAVDSAHRSPQISTAILSKVRVHA